MGWHVERLTEVLRDVLAEIKEICELLRVEDLSVLRYETIAIAVSEVKAKTKKAGTKKYKYIQLKGYYYHGSGNKTDSKTIKVWRVSEAPISHLRRLVRLYRGACYLSKSIDLLFVG